MGSEVATRSRTEVAQGGGADPFALIGNELGGSNALYAKFNANSGEFSYGAESNEIEAGEKLAANVGLCRKGWICWVDSEVVEEIMVPVVQGQPPAKSALPDYGPYKKHEDGTEDGWSEQFAIDFRLLGEDHDGVEIVYKTSTKSALRPLGDLLKQYAKGYKLNPGKVPIVEFSKGSFMPKEKKHGKKYYPVFKIVDWIDEDELAATYGAGSRVDEDDENDNLLPETKPEPAKKAEKPKAEKATKAQPAPEPEADEDDEEAALLAQLAAARAKKKQEAEAAAKAAAEEPEAEEEEAGEETTEVVEKPVPAARQTRRRSF